MAILLHYIYYKGFIAHLPAMHVYLLCAWWYLWAVKGSSSLSFCRLPISPRFTSCHLLCPKLTDAPYSGPGSRPPLPFPKWRLHSQDPRTLPSQGTTHKFSSIVSHNAGNFSSVVFYTKTESYAVNCIPEKFSALYPTTPQFFFCCIPQWKIFSSVVGYNERGLFSLWDTTEEAFLHCGGIQRKRFFSVVGYNEKEKFTTQTDIFKF